MPKSPIHKTPAKILGLSAEELEKIKEQLPYFNPARMLLLKKHQGTGDATEQELHSSAVWSHDRKKLYDYLRKRNITEQPAIDQEVMPYLEPVSTEQEETPDPGDIQLIEQEVEHIEEEQLISLEEDGPVEEEVTPWTEVQPEQAEVNTVEGTAEAQEELPEVPSEEVTEAQTDVSGDIDTEPVSDMQPEESVNEPETATISERETYISTPTWDPKAEAEEEEDDEEETSAVTLPEARKFIVADHTFDEWLDHFKKGKHNIKKSIEDMPKAKEEAADELDKLIESSLPATFFHDKLESETQYAKGLENFIDTQKKKKAGVAKPAETGLVTETLGKIYERQGLVDKAVSVYEALILKNPEKSAYFAVQIERLKNK